MRLACGIVVVSMVILGARGEACSCLGPPDPATALKRSDAVFVAKVVAIRIVNDTISVDSSFVARFPPKFPTADSFRIARTYGRATLRVQRSWKGVEQGSTLVMNMSLGGGVGGGDCGYTFLAGRRYLIYARRTASGDLSTSICTRTRIYAIAAEDTRVLNAQR